MGRMGSGLRRVAGLVLLWALVPSDVRAVQLVFKDAQYSFQTLRALGYAPSGGADVGEVLKTAYAITEGDDESWYREWLKTASRCESTGEEFLARGRKASARQEFLRASNYYRTAEFFLHTDPEDPRILATWRKSRDTFRKAATLADRPILPVEIPYEGTKLPGYLCLADGSGTRAPLLIIHSGFDGTAEELYFELAHFAVRRGFHVLLFEGPGQGGVIRVQRLPFRPDWEVVVRAVVDFALARPEVDPARVALVGISFGGYLAPRAAAFEKRLKALVADGGVYDFHLALRLRPEDEAALATEEGRAAIDRAIAERTKTDPSLRWSMANAMFTFHAKSPTDWFLMTRAYTLKDVASKITCRTLIVDSEGDRDMPGQAKLLYEALECPRDYLLFTREDGAEEHCQMGAVQISSARILDWLEEALAPTAKGEARP